MSSTTGVKAQKEHQEKRRLARLTTGAGEDGVTALREARGRGEAQDVVFENGKLKIVYQGAT